MIRGIPADTTLEAARVQIKALRRMSLSERLMETLKMSDAMRQMAEEGFRRRHPDYPDDQIHLATTRLAIGDDIFRAAYPGAEVTL